MSISSFVARVGSNPQFVAFNAHWGCTTIFLAALHKWAHPPMLPLILGVVLAAGVKEFWFDAREEADQTFLDNLEDFLGYMVGVAAYLGGLV